MRACLVHEDPGAGEGHQRGLGAPRRGSRLTHEPGGPGQVATYKSSGRPACLITSNLLWKAARSARLGRARSSSGCSNNGSLAERRQMIVWHGLFEIERIEPLPLLRLLLKYCLSALSLREEIA
jgi:hypothetical protein